MFEGSLPFDEDLTKWMKNAKTPQNPKPKNHRLKRCHSQTHKSYNLKGVNSETDEELNIM